MPVHVALHNSNSAQLLPITLQTEPSSKVQFKGSSINKLQNSIIVLVYQI